jgi:hypothetical protein
MHRKDSGNRFRKRSDCKVRLLSKRFGVLMIDEDRATTSRPCTINITPAIPDHKTGRQVYFQHIGRMKEHSGLWFSACARVAELFSGVKARREIVDLRQRTSDFRIDCVGLRSALCPASHVGLVGNYHEKKSGGFETLAADQDILVKFKFLHVCWRIWTAVSDEGPIKYAVAV